MASAAIDGLRLQRIINTESYRFPSLFTDAYEQSARPVVQHLAARLAEETRPGRLAVSDPMATATVFMSMVVGGPVRSIVLGMPLSHDEIDRRIRFSVRLFLDGARAR